VQYRQALIKRYQHTPEVHKIHAARKAPKFIKTQTEVAQVHKESQQRKQVNRAKYDKTGTEQFVSDRTFATHSSREGQYMVLLSVTAVQGMGMSPTTWINM